MNFSQLTLHSLHIAEIPEGAKVLLLSAIDVDIKDAKIIDDFRLQRIKPTIEYLKNKKAKIILIGHVGQDGSESTEPIAKYFGFKYLDSLYPKLISEEINLLNDGEGIVLKNVRSDPREKANNESFARQLASCADIFVNESFPDAHRPYASVVGIPNFLPTYFGFEFMDEVKNLSKALDPEHPSLVILGGAKADTKIPLVHQFASKADVLFVGGSLANTLFKAKGYETGISLVDGDLNDAKKILEYKNVLLPADVVLDNPDYTKIKNPDGLNTSENMLDIGRESIKILEKEIKNAKFILWNGPLGVYERGFTKATEALAKLLSESEAITIVGGGDTVTAIKKLGLLDKFTFVSIGGGAMIDLLVKGTLPAIEALTF